MDYFEKLNTSKTLERILVDGFDDDVKNGNTNVQYAVGKVLEEILTVDQVFSIMKRAHDLHVKRSIDQDHKQEVYKVYKDAVGYHLKHPSGAEYEMGERRTIDELMIILKYGAEWKLSDMFTCEWIAGIHSRMELIKLLEATDG